MLKKIFKMILKGILILALLAAGVLLLPRLVTGIYAMFHILPPEKVPEQRVAIVFGAGLWRDGSPTPVLRDRVETAAELYFSGKVEKLLMSGTTVSYYNETKAMRNYAMELGVPNEAIVQDYFGLRTYDTCFRAREVFGVQQAVLVTQKFHLPRALYLCNAMGIQSIGVAADLQPYRLRSRVFWNLREIPATLVALWELYVSHPAPEMGDPQPIFPNEVQSSLWNVKKH